MCSLLEHCRRHRYLSQSGEELALLLSSLLENLLAYRTITHDESPEHRMSCTVNVLVRPATGQHCLCIKQLPVPLCRLPEMKMFSKWCNYRFSLAEFLQRKKEGGHLYSVSQTERLFRHLSWVIRQFTPGDNVHLHMCPDLTSPALNKHWLLKMYYWILRFCHRQSFTKFIMSLLMQQLRKLSDFLKGC